jgi:hypothetical protein
MVTTRGQEKQKQLEGIHASKKQPTRSRRKHSSYESVTPKKQDKKRESTSSSQESAVLDTKHASVDWTNDELMLEMGHIYFFYRPKVSAEEVHSDEDVARLHILLKPFSGDSENEHKNRFLLLGKKHLPDVSRHEKAWGYVDAVGSLKHIEETKFESYSYHTKTHGDREIKPLRPCGEGVYALVKHHKGTVLAYVLELPEDLTEVQKSFNIQHEASFYVQIKNPDSANYNGRANYHKAELADDLKEKYGKREWIPLETVTFIDRFGVEFLLIGASADIVGELQEEGKKIEEQASIETKKGFDAKDIYKQLRMKKETHPIDPIFGSWA